MALKIPLLYKQALKQIQDHGFEVYLVGGCVRDHLLGLKIKDYDFVTTATPEEGKKIFPTALKVGESFGVLRIPLGSGEVLDLATARKDGPYSDSRHPDFVEYASIIEDLNRRDFTINALLYDPIKHEIVDLVGGKDDLDKRLIRAVGNPQERFKEDPLRMWRGVRFQVKLGFSMEKETRLALKDLKGLAKTPSKERITEELKQSLSIDSILTLSLLREYGLDHVFFKDDFPLIPTESLSLMESLVYLSLEKNPENFSREILSLSSDEKNMVKRFRGHFDSLKNFDTLSTKEKNRLVYSVGFEESKSAFEKIYGVKIDLSYKTNLNKEVFDSLLTSAKEVMALGFSGKDISSTVKLLNEALLAEEFSSLEEKGSWIKKTLRIKKGK